MHRRPGDLQRVTAPGRVLGGVGSGQQGLDQVHRAVGAAIGLALSPARVVRLPGHAGLVVQKPLLHNGKGSLQQVAGTGAQRQVGAARGQDDEGVGVRRLAGQVVAPLEPSTVLVVLEGPGERLHAVVGQVRPEGRPAQGCEGVDVGHPGGDPRGHRPIQLEAAPLVEPAEAVAGHQRGPAELEQPGAFGGQPRAVPRVGPSRGEGGQRVGGSTAGRHGAAVSPIARRHRHATETPPTPPSHRDGAGRSRTNRDWRRARWAAPRRAAGDSIASCG